jgi:4-carboxymuconolactone decarboxylase
VTLFTIQVSFYHIATFSTSYWISAQSSTMPDRYAPIPPSQLSSEQHKAYDEASKIATDMFGDKFLYKTEDGSFIGPFAPLLYTPTLIDPFFKLVIEIGKIPGLPAEARETAILTTGSHYKAGFELYAHMRVASSTTSLSSEQIKSISEGVKPTGDSALDEQCEVAFDVSIELAKGGGPLSDKNWKRALDSFGKEGAAALIQYVGVYAYTCILLNGVDASVPES